MTAAARSAPPPQRRDAGFSLLEVLTAITLVALLAVMAAGGARFASAAWERSEAAADAALETRAAQKFLRRLFAGARFVRLRDGTREPAALFDGAAKRVRFAAIPPAALAAPGEHLFELAIEPASGSAGEAFETEALVLRWVRLGEGPPAIAADAPQEVLAVAAELQFSFFGAGGRDNRQDADQLDRTRGVWSPEWRGRSAMPALIALRPAREGAAPGWRGFAARVGGAR